MGSEGGEIFSCTVLVIVASPVWEDQWESNDDVVIKVARAPTAADARATIPSGTCLPALISHVDERMTRRTVAMRPMVAQRRTGLPMVITRLGQ